MNELSVPQNWQTLKEQADMLVKSGFLPVSVNTPEKAIAIALTAKELGIGWMEGLRSINVIQGKPTISPQLMLAMANRTGQLEDIKIDATNERCIVTVVRKGRQPHTVEFGAKEATDLGLINRDNYRKQPATMFQWRALAGNLRVSFPDVMLGFYTPEEMGANVKVGEGDTMEVLPDEPEFDTGVRAPAGWLALSRTDPDKAQEMIGGKGYYVKNTPKGRYIFTKEPVTSDDMAKLLGKVEPEPQKTAPIQPESVENDPELVSHEEQLEIVRMAKEKGIHHLTMKKALKEEFGFDGSAKVTKEKYAAVIEWIIRNQADAVES